MDGAPDSARTQGRDPVPAGPRRPRAATSRSSTKATKRALDREQILLAALAVVDAEGLDALSMRRLGAELGRDPMVIYRHTPNRDAVLDGVAELVIEQLPPPIVTGDWQQGLRSLAHAFRQLALAHPHIAPLLITRPLATPIGLRPLGTLRPMERTLALLVAAGFTQVDALHVHRAYTSFVNGHILNELQEVVVNPDESEDLLRLGLYRLPRTEFPHTRALASALADYDGAAELDQGLDVLLSGLRAHLRG